MTAPVLCESVAFKPSYIFVERDGLNFVERVFDRLQAEKSNWWCSCLCHFHEKLCGSNDMAYVNDTEDVLLFCAGFQLHAMWDASNVPGLLSCIDLLRHRSAEHSIGRQHSLRHAISILAACTGCSHLAEADCQAVNVRLA